MKTQNNVLWFSTLIFMALVSSCAQSTVSVTTSSSATPSLPARSATPTPTPLPTNSPVPAPTSTMIPTLPVEDAQARLLDLLANNGGCPLPCLWGIVPGESSFQEAKAILAPIGSLSLSVYLNPPGPGDITPRFIEGDLEIYNRLAFLTDPAHNIVNRVAFNAEAHRLLKEGGYEDIFDSRFFGERVSAYALSHVLTEQGIPSSVMISTFGGPLTRGGRGGFDILLLYPDQGILVNYTTEMHFVGPNVRGCPVNAHVEMELYPPGQSDSFFESLKQTDWAVKMDGYRPLEEVTSMSVEEFYQTFREPTNECLETPSKFWPIPEP
jgi:hypothetical protein